MFKAVFPPREKVTLYFEGVPIEAEAGMTVSAALLQVGIAHTRTTAIKHEERGTYCGMGICYECLMEIDGEPNRQACLTRVRDGMKVGRGQGDPDY